MPEPYYLAAAFVAGVATTLMMFLLVALRSRRSHDATWVRTSEQAREAARKIDPAAEWLWIRNARAHHDGIHEGVHVVTVRPLPEDSYEIRFQDGREESSSLVIAPNLNRAKARAEAAWKGAEELPRG